MGSTQTAREAAAGAGAGAGARTSLGPIGSVPHEKWRPGREALRDDVQASVPTAPPQRSIHRTASWPLLHPMSTKTLPGAGSAATIASTQALEGQFVRNV